MKQKLTFSSRKWTFLIYLNSPFFAVSFLIRQKNNINKNWVIYFRNSPHYFLVHRDFASFCEKSVKRLWKLSKIFWKLKKRQIIAKDGTTRKLKEFGFGEENWLFLAKSNFWQFSHNFSFFDKLFINFLDFLEFFLKFKSKKKLIKE